VAAKQRVVPLRRRGLPLLPLLLYFLAPLPPPIFSLLMVLADLTSALVLFHLAPRYTLSRNPSTPQHQPLSTPPPHTPSAQPSPEPAQKPAAHQDAQGETQPWGEEAGGSRDPPGIQRERGTRGGPAHRFRLWQPRQRWCTCWYPSGSWPLWAPPLHRYMTSSSSAPSWQLPMVPPSAPSAGSWRRTSPRTPRSSPSPSAFSCTAPQPSPRPPPSLPTPLPPLQAKERAPFIPILALERHPPVTETQVGA